MDAETTRDTRIEILRYLYARPSAAMPLAAIQRAVRKTGVEAEEAAIAREIGILTAQGLLTEQRDPDMPAIKGWQISAAGIAHHEKHHA